MIERGAWRRTQDQEVWKTRRFDAEREDTPTVRGLSFDRFVELYRQDLLDYIKRRIRDHHAAEDLCQETFVRAFQAFDTLKSLSRMRGWLYSIAYHVTVDWLRGMAARRRCRMAYAGSGGAPRAAPPSDTEVLCREENRLRHRRFDRIWTLAKDLPPIYRQVFELRYRRWRPIAGISKHLGLPEGNVKVRLFRARKMLFRAVERKGLDRFFDRV